MRENCLLSLRIQLSNVLGVSIHTSSYLQSFKDVFGKRFNLFLVPIPRSKFVIPIPFLVPQLSQKDHCAVWCTPCLDYALFKVTRFTRNRNGVFEVYVYALDGACVDKF